MCEDEWDGKCGGYTVHEGDDAHPTLLGPDGEPLRIMARNRIGFDLTPSRKSRETVRGILRKRSAARA